MNYHITWCQYQPSKNEKPSQWFLHGKPCTVRSIGLRDGRVRHILVKTDDGELFNIESDGESFPGITYEMIG